MKAAFKSTVLAAALAACGLGSLAAPLAASSPAQRAQALLAQMTLAEKLAMLHGGAGCGYAGCVDANARLGIPPLHLQDGPAGVGDGLGGVTLMPAPVAAAATWNTALMRSYGQVLGNEQWGKGTNVVLAPTINIVRDPRWGRAFESLGEDPLLAGAMAASEIQGIQSKGPMAQVKHYVAYNQETFRNSTADDVIVSDRALHEIYLPAFAAAVGDGNADSAMCSYSVINGSFACENDITQNGLLKGELAFGGFITSDWGATHSTVPSANGGLDMEMPGADYFGTALTQAVASGQIATSTIDDKVLRILTSMFRRGLFDKTQTGNTGAVVTTAAHVKTARDAAVQGSVLLKNAGGVLPLASTVRSIAVIGAADGASVMAQGGGSAGVAAGGIVSPYQGLLARAGSAVSVSYSPGALLANSGLPPIDASYLAPDGASGHGLHANFYNGTALAGAPVASRVDPTVDFAWHGGSPIAGVGATNWSASWQGTLTPPVSGSYTFSLTSDDGSRLFVNGQKIIDGWVDQATTTRTGTIALTAGQAVHIEVDYYQAGGDSDLSLGWLRPGENLHDEAVAAARAADVALVVVNKGESEGGDLADIELSADQNQLVADVAAANPRTVVVVNSGSAVTMPWVDSVAGVIEAWYPGQAYGDALAALVFGDENFSGKLPVSFPRALADVPAHTVQQFPGQGGQVQYSEGVGVGYRWYDARGIAPLFPFGFGLSYTSFGYANLVVGAPDADGNVAVSFDVTNTGARAGAEVAQVYVGEPASTGEPPRNLRAFQRVTIDPHQTKHVSATLAARSFQYWNAGWITAAGAHQVCVGGSSRSLPLCAPAAIAAPKALNRSGWVVAASSSSMGDQPPQMIDGNAATRWTTGQPMTPGQWITVDLQASKAFSALTMDSAASITDYAARFQVYVSKDGVNWGSPVYAGVGTAPLLTARFAPVHGRYVRVVQLGSSSSWWSIAELNLWK